MLPAHRLERVTLAQHDCAQIWYLQQVSSTISAPNNVPRLKADLINYLHNCVSYDLKDGSLGRSAFNRSDNVWNLLANPTLPASAP